MIVIYLKIPELQKAAKISPTFFKFYHSKQSPII